MPPPAHEPVAVVGTGVKTPAGLTADDLWVSLCERRSTAEPYHHDRLPPDARVLVCRAGGFDPERYFSPVEQRRLDRAHQLGIGAAQDALDATGGSLPPRERCAIVCGVGLGAAAFQEEQYGRLREHGLRGVSPVSVPMMMPGALAALLSLRFGFTGPSVTVSTACASGATAIAHGVDLLRHGAADLVLAGGADSLLTLGGVAGFLRLDVMSRQADCPSRASRPFDADRDGFVMGEGAGFVVLLRARDARAAGRTVLGYVLGHASTSDAYNLVAPSVDGSGALACMRHALADAGIAASEVGHVNAHGTSTVPGDRSEALALAALFPGGTPPVTAVKGTTGHLIAGSGAVEAIVSLHAMRTGWLPPVAGFARLDPAMTLDVVHTAPRRVGTGPALSNAFGFGGMNTALVLGAP